MSPNARPNITNARRSSTQTSAYSSSAYSSLPATSFATERARSRSPRHNDTVAQGIHLMSHTPKVRTRAGQPSNGTRLHHRYPYTPADISQDPANAQNRNEQERLSSRDQRKCQARGRERPTPVNHVAPTSPQSTAKHAVAMTFVPEQPAKRAVAFESSLFQRDDPSVALPRSYQRTPLSELNISRNISFNRSSDSPPPKYTPHWEESLNSTYKPLEKPRVRPLPPLSSTLSRPVRPSEIPPYPYEKEREVVDKASSQTRRTSRASALPRPPRK